MIKYIQGDLLKGGDRVIVHGCNCLCNMGAGVALYISDVYPEAYMIDKATKYKDESKLGTYTSWTGENKFFLGKLVTVVNAYTQFYPNPKLKPFDYDAFAKVLPKIRDDFADKTIGFPKIGAGLAMGDWNRISKMIDDCFQEREVKVYVL
jgi:O-acetyl-ADP-ribose deacetylase (regulator of RNase III)